MMLGVRGGLISESYAKTDLRELLGQVKPSDDSALIRIASSVERQLGPASGVCTIADVAAIPILEVLGYRVTSRANHRDIIVLQAVAGAHRVAMVVALWGTAPDAIRRQLLLSGIAADSRWCLLCNGQVLRLVDALHSWSRLYLEFDLRTLLHDGEARDLLLNLVAARALGGSEALLDRAVEQSARHGATVCRALSDGVMQALDIVLASLDRQWHVRHRRPVPGALLEQSLTVLYRVLFLLFAEARSLVPMWDPVYPRPLHHRRHRRGADNRQTVSRHLAGIAGNLAAGACRLPRWLTQGHGIQRPALLTVTCDGYRACAS